MKTGPIEKTINLFLFYVTLDLYVRRQVFLFENIVFQLKFSYSRLF